MAIKYYDRPMYSFPANADYWKIDYWKRVMNGGPLDTITVNGIIDSDEIKKGLYKSGKIISERKEVTFMGDDGTINSLEKAKERLNVYTEVEQAYLYKMLYLLDMRIDKAEAIIKKSEGKK